VLQLYHLLTIPTLFKNSVEVSRKRPNSFRKFKNPPKRKEIEIGKKLERKEEQLERRNPRGWREGGRARAAPTGKRVRKKQDAPPPSSLSLFFFLAQDSRQCLESRGRHRSPLRSTLQLAFLSFIASPLSPTSRIAPRSTLLHHGASPSCSSRRPLVRYCGS
jgi:hypothetical protein